MSRLKGEGLTPDQLTLKMAAEALMHLGAAIQHQENAKAARGEGNEGKAISEEDQRDAHSATGGVTLFQRLTTM